MAAADYSFALQRKIATRVGLAWRNPLSPGDVSQADPNERAKYKQRDQCCWRKPATPDRAGILLWRLDSINDIQFWFCIHSPSLCRLRDIRGELEHGKGAASSHRLVNGSCPVPRAIGQRRAPCPSIRKANARLQFYLMLRLRPVAHAGGRGGQPQRPHR